jgi:hypothetical protein
MTPWEIMRSQQREIAAQHNEIRRLREENERLSEEAGSLLAKKERKFNTINRKLVECCTENEALKDLLRRWMDGRSNGYPVSKSLLIETASALGSEEE